MRCDPTLKVKGLTIPQCSGVVGPFWIPANYSNIVTALQAGLIIAVFAMPRVSPKIRFGLSSITYSTYMIVMKKVIKRDYLPEIFFWR
jgi:hypothetical protein